MLVTRCAAVVATCSLSLFIAGCAAWPTTPTAVIATLPHPSSALVIVTGTVRSRGGAPLGGASITVREASTPPDCLSCGAASARADAAGRFVLTVARGDYLIMCATEGGSFCRIEGGTASGSVTVTSGTRDIVLVADARPPATASGAPSSLVRSPSP